MNASDQVSSLVPAIPTDDALLAAIGRVALHNTHLEMELKMWVKTLAGIQPDEARRALQYMPFSQLRKLVVKLARKRISDDVTRLRIGALIQRASELSDQRNTLLHAFWACEQGAKDEIWLVQAGETATRAPTTENVDHLASDLVDLFKTLNRERHVGFVRCALSPPKKEDLIKEAKDDD